jgi:hemolysin III
LAVVGIIVKAVAGANRAPILSTSVYLGMGWLAVLAIRPLWQQMPLPGLMWLLAGGIAYSLGITAFAAVRLRYSHFVWHLFVLAGTACHFIAVLHYSV